MHARTRLFDVRKENGNISSESEENTFNGEFKVMLAIVGKGNNSMSHPEYYGNARCHEDTSDNVLKLVRKKFNLRGKEVSYFYSKTGSTRFARCLVNI